MQSLGERIAYYRKQKGYVQEQLAEKMGVTAQSVSKWENDITCPDISSLPLLAEIFGITTDQLLGVATPELTKQAQTLTNKEKSNLMLKISVLSMDGDRVNINLPYTIIKVAIQTGVKIPAIGDKLGDINFDQVFELVEMGMLGKIVEVNSADGDQVEISVE
ncbi:MAG: helix-turn-helix transcriptional regulator [Clostridia bacterium]|nr:helix-turn-helix transcriptional regulator [Clostridia bacterium]MDD3832117.1 helix-turn-helix transcriptional regulator [Clostridia bacterium]